jgi:hypothetical protein
MGHAIARGMAIAFFRAPETWPARFCHGAEAEDSGNFSPIPPVGLLAAGRNFDTVEGVDSALDSVRLIEVDA